MTTPDYADAAHVESALQDWADGGLPQRARRDGCDCLPQTSRCVHLDGMVLTFTEARLVTGHKSDCLYMPKMWGFAVWVTPEIHDTKPCLICDGGVFSDMQHDSRHKCCYEGDSEADALAAFAHAEAELIAGGEA